MDYRIQGIPCKVELTHLFVQPALGPRCDSDLDCYGYVDVEFDVLDRNGRPAPWLERKMSDSERSKIERLLLEEEEENEFY